MVALSGEMRERLLEVGDEILRVFYPYGIPDQAFWDAQSLPFLRGALYMTGRCRRTHDGLNRPKVRRQMGIVKVGQECPDGVEATLQLEAEDAPKPAHLLSGDGVMFV